MFHKTKSFKTEKAFFFQVKQKTSTSKPQNKKKPKQNKKKFLHMRMHVLLRKRFVVSSKALMALSRSLLILSLSLYLSLSLSLIIGNFLLNFSHVFWIVHEFLSSDLIFFFFFLSSSICLRERTQKGWKEENHKNIKHQAQHISTCAFAFVLVSDIWK